MQVPQHRSAHTRQLGVTLVELIVAIAIVAILSMIAVPSFQSQIASSRVTSSTNELVSSLSQARTDAIRLGKRVTVCRSTDGTSCALGSTGWETGWITIVESDVSGTTAAVQTGDTVGQVVGAQSDGISIKATNVAADYVSYAPDGTARPLPGDTRGGATNTNLRICSTSSALADSARAREIRLNLVGRLQTSKATVAATCPAP